MVTLATAVVRAWTRLYTWRVSAEARESRRAEIESDLWEALEDCRISGSPWRAAAQMVARLMTGIPDDVAWHFEQASAERPERRRYATTYIGAAALFAFGALCAVFVFAAMEPDPMPAPPPELERLLAPAPGEEKLMLMPPPPPPPPPPPRRRIGPSN